MWCVLPCLESLRKHYTHDADKPRASQDVSRQSSLGEQARQLMGMQLTVDLLIGKQSSVLSNVSAQFVDLYRKRTWLQVTRICNCVVALSARSAL